MKTILKEFHLYKNQYHLEKDQVLAQLSDYGENVSDHSEKPEVKLDVLSFPGRLNDRLYGEESLVDKGIFENEGKLFLFQRHFDKRF